jgi:uncharacterized protein (DUF1800 family)
MSVLLERWRPGRGEFDRAAAIHLLQRAGLGFGPAAVAAALERGLDATIDALFDEPQHDATLSGSIGSLLGTGSIESLQAWWLALVLGAHAPARERLTLLWHDHFATSWDKVQDVRLMHGQNELFRRHGGGDFRELLRLAARDPAMLVWLDGNSNRRGHPNENFAREVMELFALGLGNYTERDIAEAARAFTGRGVELRRFRFAPAYHDDGEKSLFGRSGRFDGDAALELILAHPACSRHVARTLLEHYAGAAPPERVVPQHPRAPAPHDWNVAHAVAVILRSRWFFEPARRSTRIAGPVELVARAIARLGASVAPARAAQACAAMGQSLFRPPSVKGWDGGAAWINAGSWIARHEFLVELARDAATRAGADELARDFADEIGVDVAGLEPAEALAATLTAPEFHLV